MMTTLDAKRGSGKYIAAYVPFGYVKSPEDKHKLVVDEYASQIVKRIFREFLSGKSMYMIAEALDQEGIETPGVYIATRKRNGSVWRIVMLLLSVERILRRWPQ